MKYLLSVLLTSTLLFGTTVNAANEIKCSPSIVHPGEKLTIKTSKAFGDISVSLPYKLNNGGTVAFLTEIDPETALIDSKKFIQQRGMEIDVDTARFNKKSLLFAKSGNYKFTVSTNLETDDGTPQYSCKVQFIAQGGVKSTQSVAKEIPSAKSNILKSAAPVTPTMSSLTKTLDEQFNQRVSAECGSGIGGLICREKVRFSICSDKWSISPPVGEESCRKAG